MSAVIGIALLTAATICNYNTDGTVDCPAGLTFERIEPNQKFDPDLPIEYKDVKLKCTLPAPAPDGAYLNVYCQVIGLREK